ncbi:MAG: PorT family protein [Prevotellaceae bacterium]|jgi:hypothetical protein|nr:PorT family protein [Prevotellaceae bacterium]
MLFNKKILQQIDNYEIELPENDWEILSQKLNSEEKSRKFALWWYAAAASVALLIGFGVFFGTQTTQIEQSYTENSESAKSEDVLLSEVETTYNTDAENLETKITAGADLKFAPTTTYHAQVANLHHQKDKNLPKNAFQKDTAKEETHSSGEIPVTIGIAPTQLEKPQISIEQAEKLMQAKENIAQTADSQTKKAQKNSAYASLLASIAPAGFSVKQQPKYLFAPSRQNAIAASSYTNTKHDLPLTVGVNFGVPIAERFYFNTGLQYSYIHSRESVFGVENNDLVSTDDQNLHYIGIPAMFSYRIIDGRVIKLYVSAGGTVEKGLVETHNRKNFGTENIAIEPVPSEKIDGFQFSLNANIGASVTLFKGTSLYFEPGFAWYIENKKYIQPYSSRTKHPYYLSLTAGLRFNFEKN